MDIQPRCQFPVLSPAIDLGIPVDGDVPCGEPATYTFLGGMDSRGIVTAPTHLCPEHAPNFGTPPCPTGRRRDERPQSG